MKVYMDNAATTALAPQVLEEMMPYLTEHYGNPSSVHGYGRKTRAAIEKARKVVANYLHVSPAEIFFTSGGTEANNTIIKNVVRDMGVRNIISSPVEHHCVLHSVHATAAQVNMVRVNQYGEVDYAHLEELLSVSKEKTLVSLMHGNNELGTLLDLARVGELCAAHRAYFHTDTVQTMGFYPIDVQATKVHFLSGSAHKFHGPKGIGFFYLSKDATLKPLLDGGSQERNMRAGTENLYGIVGLGKALELAAEHQQHMRKKITELRQYMILQLKNHIPEVTFNSYEDERSHYKVLNVSLPPSPKSDLLIFNLDIAGIAASGGSACSSGSEIGSHVLAAIGAPSSRKAVRFSFCESNTLAEVDYVVQTLKRVL